MSTKKHWKQELYLCGYPKATLRLMLSGFISTPKPAPPASVLVTGTTTESPGQNLSSSYTPSICFLPCPPWHVHLTTLLCSRPSWRQSLSHTFRDDPHFFTPLTAPLMPSIMALLCPLSNIFIVQSHHDPLHSTGYLA